MEKRGKMYRYERESDDYRQIIQRVRQDRKRHILTVNLTPGWEGRTPDCLISSLANMQATLVGAKSRWTVTSSLGRIDNSPCRVRRSSGLNILWSWGKNKFICTSHLNSVDISYVISQIIYNCLCFKSVELDKKFESVRIKGQNILTF